VGVAESRIFCKFTDGCLSERTWEIVQYLMELQRYETSWLTFTIHRIDSQMCSGPTCRLCVCCTVVQRVQPGTAAAVSVNWVDTMLNITCVAFRLPRLYVSRYFARFPTNSISHNAANIFHFNSTIISSYYYFL